MGLNAGSIRGAFGLRLNDATPFYELAKLIYFAGKISFLRRKNQGLSSISATSGVRRSGWAKKPSWPWSVSISAYCAETPASQRRATSWRTSSGGKSQSELMPTSSMRPDAPQGRRFHLRIAAQVKRLDRSGKYEIAIGVEAFDEDAALIVEIAADVVAVGQTHSRLLMMIAIGFAVKAQAEQIGGLVRTGSNGPCQGQARRRRVVRWVVAAAPGRIAADGLAL